MLAVNDMRITPHFLGLLKLNRDSGPDIAFRVHSDVPYFVVNLGQLSAQSL